MTSQLVINSTHLSSSTQPAFSTTQSKNWFDDDDEDDDDEDDDDGKRELDADAFKQTRRSKLANLLH
jgi:hypothetical protein